jgi:hypothetical protein
MDGSWSKASPREKCKTLSKKITAAKNKTNKTKQNKKLGV